MNIWSSFAGVVAVEITSAAVEKALYDYSINGIILTNIRQVDDLTVTATISRLDLKRMRKISNQKGDSIKLLERNGIYWSAKSIFARPVLLVGMMLLCFLAIYLPTRVLFVTVDGNRDIPAGLIVEKAAQCGIGFGASRREVRSEKVKNALLEEIQQLKWVGVNTYGCLAVISVEERSDVHTEEQAEGICSIVASRDGVIDEMSVLRGSPLCKVGEAVKKGQTLISGYTDCGLIIKAERANGEVFVKTMRSQSALTLLNSVSRGVQIDEKQYYSLKIGKNIINLWKDSGISDVSCVKMKEQIPLTLPGGFQLPVSLIKEQIIHYDSEHLDSETPQDFEWLKEQVQAYVRTQMVAGQILQNLTACHVQDDVCRIDGIYACREMIGQVYYERNFRTYG